MSLFVKKPIAGLIAEAQETGPGSLKRTLGPWALVALGIGAIIGAGLFSITGIAAANQALPLRFPLLWPHWVAPLQDYAMRSLHL